MSRGRGAIEARIPIPRIGLQWQGPEPDSRHHLYAKSAQSQSAPVETVIETQSGIAQISLK